MSNLKSFLGVFLILIVIVGCVGTYNSASPTSGSGSLNMSQKAIDEFGKAYVERFERMFQTGNISFSVRNNNDSNILHYVAFTGDLNRVKTLVEMGANVNEFDNSGKSDAQKGLEFISNSNDCSGKAPLYYAAQSGNLEVVKCLVEHGVDVNAKDWGGETVLDRAIRSGNQELVKWLKEHGAKPKEELK